MVNNNSNIVDKIHFEKLASCDPKDVCRQSLCKYDDENKKYTISVWGDDYNIYPHEFKIDCIKGGNSDPHEIPTSLISKEYRNDIEAFGERCMQLGGTSLDFADAAYGFNIVPQIPLAVLYWEGDDDFSPEAKILYDKSMIDYLPSDILFSLVVEVCARIGKVSIS